MAVVIRMKRTGRRNRPCYRISVADRALPRDGRTLDTLGHYDPASPKPELRLRIDVERAKEWIARGALPSHTVRSILKREGAFEGAPRQLPRRRTGRKIVTKSREQRIARKSTQLAAKQARHAARIADRRSAAKAAKAAAAAEGE